MAVLNFQETYYFLFIQCFRKNNAFLYPKRKILKTLLFLFDFITDEFIIITQKNNCELHTE